MYIVLKGMNEQTHKKTQWELKAKVVGLKKGGVKGEGFERI